MTIQSQPHLEDIKFFYTSSIETLLFKSMDDLCQFDPNQVRRLISELWLYDFLPKNSHLDEKATKEVFHIFEAFMNDLDTSHYNKRAFVKF